MTRNPDEESHYVLDEVDRGVLNALQRDARNTTISEIAEELGISATTVRNRIHNLEDAGIIEGYRPEINYERAGYQLQSTAKSRFDLTPRQEQILELVLIIFYLGLTAFGVAMAAGLLWPDLVFANPSNQFPSDGIYADLFVPPHIYLFSFLGALAHVFIALFLFPVYHNKRVDLTQLIEASIRIPLAVLLSTALFLLTALLGFTFSGRTLAGISFLVGLYVRETVMAFVVVVERVFKTTEGPDLGEFYWGWWPGQTESEAGEDAVLQLPGSDRQIPLTVRLRSSQDGMSASFVTVREVPGANRFSEADRDAVTENLTSGEPAILELREGREYRVFPSIEWSRDDAGNLVVEAVVIDKFVADDE